MLQQLVKLGLSSEEAKVYLATLELGGGFVSVVARKAKVNRSTCYHTLNNLIKKGLISSFTKGKYLFFSAENPEKFLKLAQDQMETTKKLIPELLSITNALAYKPKIKFYEGVEGIKNIYEDTLSAKKEILGYTNLDAVTHLFPEFFKKYSQQKIQKGIKTRYLSPDTMTCIDDINIYFPDVYDQNLLEILLVNKKEFLFENEIAIYEDKVAIMSLNVEELMGVSLESPTFARTMKAIFDLAWLGATSFIAK